MTDKLELFDKSHLLFTIVRGLAYALEEDIKERIKITGFSIPEWRALFILSLEDKMTMTQLSMISQLNISNIFRQLTKLSAAGLVIIQDGEDARIREVKITDKGRKLIKIGTNRVEDDSLHLKSILGIVSNEDLDQFLKIGVLLCNEIVGQSYTEWAVKTSKKTRLKINDELPGKFGG